ncbi:hypothetical protein FG379_000863 [Cryptosporidium bovis]|uniref:uncharacterized protein n=1 Tax=Cryptosporidium bovis TaxID=310047 RepID=UPI00351A9C3E|nr:hypothetical protein FG379_000863 [Cryptosporidium bovis]
MKSRVLIKLIFTAFVVTTILCSYMYEFQFNANSLLLEHSLIKSSPPSLRSSNTSRSGFFFNSEIVTASSNSSSNFTFVKLEIVEYKDINESKTCEIFKLDSLNNTADFVLQNDTLSGSDLDLVKPIVLTITFDQYKNSSSLVNSNLDSFLEDLKFGSDLQFDFDFEKRFIDESLLDSDFGPELHRGFNFGLGRNFRPLFPSNRDFGLHSGLYNFNSSLLGQKLYGGFKNPLFFSDIGPGVDSNIKYTVSGNETRISLFVGPHDEGSTFNFFVGNSNYTSNNGEEKSANSGKLVLISVLGSKNETNITCSNSIYNGN